jgi:hypothetical protein
MSNEQQTTGAEQKEPGALADSIEGMKSVLDEVDAEVRQARFLFPHQEKETLKWATLRRACGRINDITRIGVQRLVDPAAGTGAFFTPKEALDAVMANPPLDPPAPETGGGATREGRDSHMSKPEAAYILCRMATSRKLTVDGVTALQMGVRSLMKRHFDRQRNWAKRRMRAAGEAEEKQNV